MLARVQQTIVTALILVALVWTGYQFATREYVLAFAGPIAIAVGLALVLGLEFAALMCVPDDSHTARPTLKQLVKAWRDEVVAATVVFCWRQPFRADAEPDFCPPHLHGKRGVVLVHGYFCNRALWNPWMRRFRDTKTPFVAINLEPVFGSISHYGKLIGAAVREIDSVTGQPPVIVAHSMGGLAVRAWLASTKAGSRVHRVITIGTPHRGTWLARFGHGTNGRQMQMGSRWLAELSASESPDFARQFTCLYSHCDNIVFPVSTATLQGADNHHVPGAAHLKMAFTEQAFAQTLRWLSPHPDAEIRDLDAGPNTGSVDSSRSRTAPPPASV